MSASLHLGANRGNVDLAETADSWLVTLKSMASREVILPHVLVATDSTRHVNRSEKISINRKMEP